MKKYWSYVNVRCEKINKGWKILQFISNMCKNYILSFNVGHQKLNVNNKLYNLSKYQLCLSVCLYPINVKTAEPFRAKFCVGMLNLLKVSQNFLF